MTVTPDAEMMRWAQRLNHNIAAGVITADEAHKAWAGAMNGVRYPDFEDLDFADVEPDDEQDWRNLPDEFWNKRKSLRHIRQAAHCRARCADSVLVAVLARVATLISPTVTLPAIVGSPASLNFFGAIVGRSGGGKTTAKDVAVELVPITLNEAKDDISPGSGEGLIEMYLKNVSETGDDGRKQIVKRQTWNRAFVFVDEGQGLLAMGDRSGSTIMPILRSAWSGATLGQQNASQETNRRIGAHKYRIGMVLGFQLAYAAALIADAEGGTPQRFVFVNATDASIPDDAPDWPGELSIDLPDVIGNIGQSFTFDAEVSAGIRRRALAATRGETDIDPLDTHTDLGRMKVAAILAVLDHGGLSVSADDWQMAGQVMRTSRAVRTWAIEEARLTHKRKAEQHIADAIRREGSMADAATERAIKGGARAIARKVHRDGSLPHAATSRTVAGKHRQMVSIGDITAYAVEQKWIKSGIEEWLPGDSAPA